MKIDQQWVYEPALQSLLSLLNQDGEEARVAGGAVRNALLEEPIKDVDIATTRLPADVTELLEGAGYKAVPTGIEHGTITAIVDAHAFEITTLRRDIETDGRHATVSFGRDWLEDARRRDFTMNALYMEADGTVFDPVSGFEDLINRRVVFIDDAEKRIREDYLRILRFFRFFAWYGRFRPDAEGLKACTRLKSGLADLSVERIWQELSRMLAAPDPSRALLWMRQTGILSAVLPESEKWGIDALPGLVAAEQGQNWQADALVRLMSIIPPREEVIKEMVERLKLSNRVRDRLLDWAASVVPDIKSDKKVFYQQLYRGYPGGIKDCLRLRIAAELVQKNRKKAKRYAKRLKQAQNWQKPVLPIRGKDIIASGQQPGPQISATLAKIEDEWVESHFKLTRDDLLAKII